MNVNLVRQGYFKEMPHAEESDPSIQTYLYSSIDAKTKASICNYLNNGVVIVACYGMSPDVVNPDAGAAGCPSLRTDGVWVWPGDLSYYVSKYSLKLNEDFLTTMKTNDWKIPISEDDIDFELLEIEGQRLLP